MSTDQGNNSAETPEGARTSSGKPVGGVSLFGSNPGLLGDLKARLRKSGSSEDDSAETRPPESSSEPSSPSKLAPAIEEPPSSPAISEKSNRSRTTSNSFVEGTDKLLPNLTGQRARRPTTRLPTFCSKPNMAPDENAALSVDQIQNESHELDIFFNSVEFLNDEPLSQPLSNKPSSPPSPSLPPVPPPRPPKPSFKAPIENSVPE